ncbi:putative Se/S carrier-like protein [Moorella naiadis (nom. illeg.)]|uniref:putative Se/S carrier-like protein n=1 Tax=Moorella naiadis (nom. illeg.) TaxID=3093670 RepID=UPI003D9CB84C
MSINIKSPNRRAQNCTLSSQRLDNFYNGKRSYESRKVAKKARFNCRLVAPPPSMRKGCDLALEIDLVKQAAIAQALAGKVSFMGIYPFIKG